MNVTEDKVNSMDSQPQNGGYLQKVSAEQKEYAEVSKYLGITERNNNIITASQEESLLEKILHRDNMNKAYHQVKSNKGAPGVDNMKVEELLEYLKRNREKLTRELREGKYKPRPVLRVEIPKEEKGEKRKLGIPTVVDRVIQQAIAQELTKIYEPQFSESSYGFRPGRSAHDAVKQCKKNVDEGYDYVVDMDLEKFFDTVCKSKLIEILSRTIKDGRVISLIHKYLNAGVINKGLFEQTEEGVPQGGPLSPLLSNIMLNELDKELEKRGHRFVRYADDCMIFCKSKKSAERVLKSVVTYIEKKLFLKVNEEKTVVAKFDEVKFLSYSFCREEGKCQLKVHPKAVRKMKRKLKELTGRTKGMGNEERKKKINEFTRGWINYFKLAKMESLLKGVDGWLRRRIRAVYWKQWKEIKTKYNNLSKYGLPKWKILQMANCRKGLWRATLMLNCVLTIEVISKLGYMSMTDYYLKRCEN